MENRRKRCKDVTPATPQSTDDEHDSLLPETTSARLALFHIAFHWFDTDVQEGSEEGGERGHR